MDSKDFTTSFTVHGTPEAAYAAINDVRAWWSGDIDGPTDQPGGEFTYRYKDVHRSTQRIVELDRGRRVVWDVIDATLNFVADKNEWNGTKIVFDITPKGEETEVRFTHVGLVPKFECYGGCSGAWGYYVNDSLRGLIAKGEGKPNERES